MDVHFLNLFPSAALGVSQPHKVLPSFQVSIDLDKSLIATQTHVVFALYTRMLFLGTQITHQCSLVFPKPLYILKWKSTITNDSASKVTRDLSPK